MPIEFTCTHCNRQLKLPDVTAGLQGNCPHCQGEFIAPQPNLPSFEELGETIVRKDYPEGFQEALDAEAEANSPFPLNNESVLAETKAQYPARPELSRPAAPTPIADELRRKKQINPLTIWVPLLLMVVVIVFAVWAALNRKPKLTGNLNAKNYYLNRLPAKTLRFSELVSQSGLSEDEVRECLLYLQENPIPIMQGEDGLMNVRLDGTPAGLTTTVIQPEGMKIVRVSLLDVKLTQYLQDHREEFEVSLQDELNRAIKDFFRDVHKARETGHSVENLARHRYRLCLNSLIGGSGYQMVAVIEERAYLCIYEDSDRSGVYFMLPENTKSFRLQGRKLSDGKTVFDGSYDVTVSED